jgi:hypothetical protein
MVQWLVMAALLLLQALPDIAEGQQGAAKGASMSAEHCDLIIRLLPEQHRMEATAALQLPAAPTPREVLPFELRSDMEVTQAEVLTPDRSAGAADLRPVRSGKEPGSATRWELRPKQPIPAHTPVTLKLSYAGGKTQGFVFYLGPEGCFAGGPNTSWYPRFSALRSVGTLRFTVPRGVVVKASGVAAGQQETAADAIYTFTVTQPSLFSFAAGRYVVHHRAGKVPMTLYLLKDRPFADTMVAGCRRVLQVLEKEFGPYPYGEFAVVETPSPQSGQSGFGGASFEGFMFADSGFLYQGFNLALFGHEIGHQWWGNLVQHTGEHGAYMLDEAMAQYGSLCCVEALEGPAAAERYRRTGYPAYAEWQSGLGAALLASVKGDLPLSRLTGDFAHYLADSKGFLVYDLLARTIGRDRFRTALRHIVATCAFRTVTWEAFLQAVERAAGQDLGWFYSQWFDRPGVPSLSLQWTQEAGELRIILRQEAPAYRLTLPLQIVLDDGRLRAAVIEATGERTELHLPLRQTVRAVAPDPHYELLHVDPALKAEVEALRFWMRGMLLQGHDRDEEAQQAFQEGLRNLPERDIYGVEFRLRSEIADYHRHAGRLEEARHEYEQALACAVRPAEALVQVYLHLAQIAKTQGDTGRLLWAVRSAQNAEGALERPTGAGQEASELLIAPASPR